jgi:chromosome segregation ATPase
MDVPVIELVLEEIAGDIRRGDAEIERMSAEIERMNAEIERIRQDKTKLESIAKSLNPLLNKPEIACSPEQVAELAHKYWAERGYTDGGHEEDWRRAEQELRARAYTGSAEVESNAAC